MNRETQQDGRGKLLALFVEKPWLIPFVYYIYTYTGLTINELRDLLGLRTQLIKRALWWLVKNNIIEKRGEKYVVKEEYSPILRDLILNYCSAGKRHVVKLGKTYYVISIRKKRITTYTVPAEIYEKLTEYEANVQTPFKPEDLAATLSISRNLATKTVHLKKILKKCYEK